MYQLTYGNIPGKWIEGLPVGNGRLAAMYWEENGQDVLSLNHERLWRGQYRGKEAPKSAHMLPGLRQLLKERRYFEATVYANLFFSGCRGGDSGMGDGRVDSYQPAGDVAFCPDGAPKGIGSELNIQTGLICAQREGTLQTEIFCDACDGNLLARWKSEAPFGGVLQFRREADGDACYSVTYQSDGLVASCRFVCGVAYEVQVKIATDGTREATEQGLKIAGATELTCAVNILLNPADARAFDLAFAERYENHKKKFAAYMDRVQFHLDQEEKQGYTDQRLEAVKKGGEDHGLLELYFHYGRYLMISSCICGQLPPNLQGKWNRNLRPEWYCDYHLDINMQMNEWMLEGVGLSEFAEPLTDFMLTFLESGRVAAKNLYGCRGIWLPISCDVWGKSTPESFGYAVWVGAAAWIAQPMWQHYVYTGDKTYLEKAYRFFKEVALFYEDFLEEDENGIMQIMPSQSPENRFAGAGAVVTVGICSSSGNDVQLAYDGLSYAIRAAEILGVDADGVEVWKRLRSKLPPFAIGSDGRLLEWNEEFREEQPGHKHLSHLYGLFPSDIFTPEGRPAEYAAAVKSFRYRMAHQSGYTGWSRAWIANIMARIGDRDGYYTQTNELLKEFATESLLDIHPHPLDTSVRIFQIDGNFGMVSGVLEALCGCFDGKVHLLRALPECWPKGSIGGIKLPGGHTISFCWENGKVIGGRLIMGFARKVVLQAAGKEMVFTAEEGEEISFGEF